MIRFTASAGGQSHDVLIGDFAAAAAPVRALGGGARLPLVSDERILALHGEQLRDAFEFTPIVLPDGEAAKTWDVLQHLITRFAELGVSRSTPVIAFGGGSIGDVTGLAAALFKRGCPVIHVPTTLLSQVDSALGGKTAIDALGQKNLVGTFHLPALIVVDPVFLDTLDGRQLRSGYAEIVKYGLIEDAAFFAWCQQEGAALLAGSRAARLKAVEHCLKAKARFAAADLRDTSGHRALLNLGHSFGHAIESLAGLTAVLHGEAVAVGLCMAFAFSAELGLSPDGDARTLRDHLESAGLPTTLASVGLSGRGLDMMPLMRADKKAGPGTLALILARGIGEAFFDRSVDEAALAGFLSRAP